MSSLVFIPWNEVKLRPHGMGWIITAAIQLNDTDIMILGYMYELIDESTGAPNSSSVIGNAKMNNTYMIFMACEQQIRNEVAVLGLQSKTAAQRKIVRNNFSGEETERFSVAFSQYIDGL